MKRPRPRRERADAERLLAEADVIINDLLLLVGGRLGQAQTPGLSGRIDTWIEESRRPINSHVTRLVRRKGRQKPPHPRPGRPLGDDILAALESGPRPFWGICVQLFGIHSEPPVDEAAARRTRRVQRALKLLESSGRVVAHRMSWGSTFYRLPLHVVTP